MEDFMASTVGFQLMLTHNPGLKLNWVFWSTCLGSRHRGMEMVDKLNLMFHNFSVICTYPITDCTGGFMSNPNSEYYIPDSSIKASSEFDSSYKASKARLHGIYCWFPADADAQPWIEADLGLLVNVSGIQTGGSGYTYWVTTLKVSTFQQVPGAGDAGYFIKHGNDIKVCNVYKRTEMPFEYCIDRPTL